MADNTAADHHGGQQQQQQPPGTVVIIAIDPLVNSLQLKIRQAMDGEPLRHSSPTIYRVRPNVREEDVAAYDPKIVSIGPFHHGEESLRPMETLKLRYLHNLLDRSPQNKLQNYIDAIRGCETRAREQYSEKIDLDSDAFVEMMVVDGSFIVEYFTKRELGEEKGPLSAVNWALSHLRNDMFLLENQIPFFVLKSIFDNSTIPLPNDESPLTLDELALHYLKIEELPGGQFPTNIHHLLHLVQFSLKPPSPANQPTMAHSCLRVISYPLRKTMTLLSPIFFGLLYLVLTCKRPHLSSSSSPPGNNKSSRFPRMIPCATELREAGISFKRKEFKRGKAPCFTEVSFFHGVIEIPLLSVEESTNSRFRNLVLFEQCCPDVGSHFTSYLVLMDNIINTAGDVAILRGCGIIESKLGDDDEVALLFNRLCKGAHLSYQSHHYAPLFREVKGYCEIARHRWRARLMHDYFNNPWAIASLVAASVLLILTAIQSFFSVFSYVRPPPQH